MIVRTLVCGTAMLLASTTIAAAKEPQLAKPSSGQKLQQSTMNDVPRCVRKMGTLSIVDGDDPRAWTQYQLAPPQKLLKVLVQRSGCFNIVDRGTGLQALGISPAALIARHPGLIVLSLNAWATDDRRGFDSLVQAESGIARIESTSDEPGALPAQALDHSAGYLLAAAAIELVGRRAREGGSWHASTSLRRVAAELLGLPRTPDPQPGVLPASADGHTQTFDVAGVQVTTAAPAFRSPAGRDAFAAPRPWGLDEPVWL